LKAGVRFRAGSATAVNKVLGGQPHFCDVKMQRYDLPVRLLENQLIDRLKVDFKFRNSHSEKELVI
jgi:hypothetical protein